MEQVVHSSVDFLSYRYIVRGRFDKIYEKMKD